jgi:lysophospholipase L1-like esterase
MRWLWTFLALVALFATIVFAGGFIYATNQILYPKNQAPLVTSQPIQKPDSTVGETDGIHILAIGDSLTAGTGDISGTGYVGHVKQMLEVQSGKPVYILNNLAIPGSRTSQWVEQLNNKQTQEAIAEADLILLSIGGNDLFQGGLGIFDEQNPEAFNAKPLEERSPDALKNIEIIMKSIHEFNSRATVVYIGLYHPFLNIDIEKTAAPAIYAWNTAVSSILQKYDRMYIVPAYDLFEREQDRFLAEDHFHPNSEGYERIAIRIAQILK